MLQSLQFYVISFVNGALQSDYDDDDDENIMKINNINLMMMMTMMMTVYRSCSHVYV